MNPRVNFYFDNDNKWQREIRQLRHLILECGLTEELKWGCPSYTFGDHNVILIHVFKEYCALLFFKGALLKNEHGMLIQQTENVQAARQIRFVDFDEIVARSTILKAYIYEAIEVEKAGLKVKLKNTDEFPVPEEFKKKLTEVDGLTLAFEALTPGRQRAYLFYFSQAKQSQTRKSRVEKCIPGILAGKGLDD